MRRYRILHVCCGAGGGGLGAAQARAEIAGIEAAFDTIGGIDIDAQACADFERLVGAPALCADLAQLQPAELLRFAGPKAPDMVLTSPPCKGFSGLLSKARSQEPKYQMLNRLVLQSIHLVLSTWAEGPRVIFLENVPRITSRGAKLLDQVRQLLRAHGYSVAEGYHDCGEVGGLGQRRRRFFLIARNTRRMPAFVYLPPQQRVKSCGEVLGALPVPGLSGDLGGPMHEIPRLSMLNLLRLASIPAGGDWRDLPGTVPDGDKRRSVHRRHMVVDWQAPAPAIGGSDSNGAAAVANPRGFSGHLGVLDPSQPAGTVTGGAAVARGAFAVADGRPLALGATADGSHRFAGSPGLMGVIDWQRPTGAVTGHAAVSSSNTPAAVADVRVGPMYASGYRLLKWDEPANTVTSAGKPSSGGASVTDPRALTCKPRAGAYGVLRWDEASALISGSLRVDNGRAAVADPRVREALAMVPENWKRPPDGLLVIVAADGTWHRALTTLELAALQSLPTTLNGEPLVLAGTSHARWRQAIGDMIPPDSAKAVAVQILEAMLAADLEAYRLRSEPIWVSGKQPGEVIV